MKCDNELCREAVDALRLLLSTERAWDKHPTPKGTRLCIAARENADAVLAKVSANSDEEDV